MGYVLAMGACIRCGQVMAFNPNKVPSIKHPKTGVKEPLCKDCHAVCNRIRREHGLEPWPEPHPEAYSAMDESELS